jgi:hypothetical protein
MTENTGLLGDFQLYSEIFNRRGINMKVSDSHSDYFVKGKQAIRADVRLALVIYRATAFPQVTGYTVDLDATWNNAAGAGRCKGSGSTAGTWSNSAERSAGCWTMRVLPRFRSLPAAGLTSTRSPTY